MAKRKIIGVKIRYWDDFSGGIEIYRDGRPNDIDRRAYEVYYGNISPERPIPNRLQRAQAMQLALQRIATDAN